LYKEIFAAELFTVKADEVRAATILNKTSDQRLAV
jgi:hypothetical protein